VRGATVLVIAENINITSRAVAAALDSRDPGYIGGLARRCEEAGADVLDINLGSARKNGAELMRFAVEAAAEGSRLQLCLDTTNPEAMEAGIVRCLELGLPRPIVNSFSAQSDKIATILPLASRYECEIIGLVMGQAVPLDTEERLATAYELVMAANEIGIPNERIYIDPIVLPLGLDVGQQHAVAVQEVVRSVGEMFEPAVKTTCGLSNVSNGAPRDSRSPINSVFLAMLMAQGLSSAIVDVLDPALMRTVRLAKAFRNESLYSVSDAELGYTPDPEVRT
jgi:5-methyltetrahydrofolate corrinoid/iron sulfur protein methyltransferase